VTPEQYAAAQAALSGGLALRVAKIAALFAVPVLSIIDWFNFLSLLYPDVQRTREQSAELARTFYDKQRAVYHPELPVHARELEPYEFEWFAKRMEPLQQKFMEADTPKRVAGDVAAVAVREVENAGRRQIINAVESDVQVKEVIRGKEIPEPEPEPVSAPETVKRLLADELAVKREKPVEPKQGEPETKLVLGWARVATGRETCAWCLMLVSRGPVYKGADSAGLDLENDTAKRMIAAGEDVSGFMEQWHVGCDCKVVPVFKETVWPGRAAKDRALELWIEASKRADAELEENPDKLYYSQKDRRWKPTTDNRETINQLRQMIESGEVSSQEWAAIQAA
jgi:hypothetical protein